MYNVYINFICFLVSKMILDEQSGEFKKIWESDDQQNKSAIIADLFENKKYLYLNIEHDDDIWEHAIYAINNRYINNELNEKSKKEFEDLLNRLDTNISIEEIIYAIKTRLKQNVEILMIDSTQIMLRNIEDNRRWSENIKWMKDGDLFDNKPVRGIDF